MTEKRYYKKDWEDSYYIFDSKTISEKEFEKKVEYDEYDIFAYSLTSKEVLVLLNENEELKKENERLKERVKQLQINNKVINKIYKTFYKPRGIKYA